MKKRELEEKIETLEEELREVKEAGNFRLKNGEIKFGPYLTIGTIFKQIPVKDVTQLILDHLNLELTQQPERIELKAKPKIKES